MKDNAIEITEKRVIPGAEQILLQYEEHRKAEHVSLKTGHFEEPSEDNLLTRGYA